MSGIDKVIVRDPTAPPIWARFYQIAMDKPIFCSTGASWDLMPETVEVKMKRCGPGKHPHTILAN